MNLMKMLATGNKKPVVEVAPEFAWRYLLHFDTPNLELDSITGLNQAQVSNLYLSTTRFGSDAADGYFQIPNAIPFNGLLLNQPFTSEAWFYNNSLPRVLRVGNANSPHALLSVYLSDGLFSIEGFYNGAMVLSAGGVITENPGYWEHIALSRDIDHVWRLLHKGSIIYTSPPLNLPFNVNSALWGENSDGVDYFSQIDEYAFFSGARTQNFTPWTRAYTPADNPLLPQPATSSLLTAGSYDVPDSQPTGYSTNNYYGYCTNGLDQMFVMSTAIGTIDDPYVKPNNELVSGLFYYYHDYDYTNEYPPGSGAFYCVLTTNNLSPIYVTVEINSVPTVYQLNYASTGADGKRIFVSSGDFNPLAVQSRISINR